jgi:hypothetical protein
MPRVTIELDPSPSVLRFMHMESQDGRHWFGPLAGQPPDGGDSEHLAGQVGAVWLEIGQALHPMIGHLGVAALYDRSLTVAGASRPWLLTGHQGGSGALDCAALKAALAQQTPAEAAAGGRALFQAFHELLTSLVGPSLTDRLLLPVWAHSSVASPVQDTSS